MGYYVAKSRLLLVEGNKKRFSFYYPMITIIQGWIISSFLHGLYDFLLSFKMESMAYLQIVMMCGISIWMSRVTLYAIRRKMLGDSTD